MKVSEKSLILFTATKNNANKVNNFEDAVLNAKRYELYYTILYYTILYYTILYYTVEEFCVVCCSTARF